MAGWVRIAALEDLPDGYGVRVEVGQDVIALFRVGDSVHALGDRCTHAEASLAEGEVFAGMVECPRHGSEFDLETGRPHSLPATSPVPVYPTKIQDGDVLLEVAT
ncbi:MAG: non-heme iron oxygenase ferredoxin subunit [Acidimicrobiia bacterium]